MLDHLSKGRLNLCFGNGSVTADQELFGVDPKDGGNILAAGDPKLHAAAMRVLSA